MALIRYEDLDVYKKAFKASIELHPLTLNFPQTEQFGGLAGQMRRSMMSICANIAEGLSKQMSIADKRKFLQIALGSTEETRVWLSYCKEFEYLSDVVADRYRGEYLEMARMLY